MPYRSATATDLKRIDNRSIPDSHAEVRLATHVYNEQLRLPHFLDHHRRIGVARFFIIDNGSDDGSFEFLLEQPDVHLFHTTEEFRRMRAVWKKRILCEYGVGCWTLNLDADELFVYPHMEEIDLLSFCRFLDEEGVRGVHATMVDMYGVGELSGVVYESGTPFLEACPYFDSDGYWLHYTPEHKLRYLNEAPPFQVRGGPRERLFYQPDRRVRWHERMIARWLYDLRRERPRYVLRWRKIWKRLRRMANRAARPHSPSMSKVPLLRWGPDIALETAPQAALHTVSPPVPLSTCWAAILHFKYFSDFASKVSESVSRRQHVDDSAEYHNYAKRLSTGDALVPYGPISRRYVSSASLLDADLMRSCKELDALAKRLRSSGAITP